MNRYRIVKNIRKNIQTLQNIKKRRRDQIQEIHEKKKRNTKGQEADKKNVIDKNNMIEKNKEIKEKNDREVIHHKKINIIAMTQVKKDKETTIITEIKIGVKETTTINMISTINTITMTNMISMIEVVIAAETKNIIKMIIVLIALQKVMKVTCQKILKK